MPTSGLLHAPPGPSGGHEGRDVTGAKARFTRFVDHRFHTLVLQPTTHCPWACRYCYLTTTGLNLQMRVPVARAAADSIKAQGSERPVQVVWHGGEPLALPLARFARLLEEFEPLREAGRVQHAVQTGAGLITDRWCELFTTHGVQVGVSIDGPDWANADRVDRAGRPVHARAMRGIRVLREHGIDFSAIAVITPDTIGRPEQIMEFFESLGAGSVGFSMEEHEGANTARPGIGQDAARRFWAALLTRRAEGSTLPVRDIDRLLSHVGRARAGAPTVVLHEPIPTVAWNGQTVLLSPELAGITAPEYGDFVLGNVLTESLGSMLARAHRVQYVEEFTRALEQCANSCEFYAFCQGAQAGNRYFEHGTFAVTETAYCRTTRQALVQALHELTTEDR
jgi:uncharacterized protein